MIQFACPRCHATLGVPDDQAGDKMACGRCKQRLQVPGTPRTQTVLAPLLPAPVGQSNLPPTPTVAEPEPPVVAVSAVDVNGQPPSTGRPRLSAFLDRNRGLLRWGAAVLAFSLIAIAALAV